MGGGHRAGVSDAPPLVYRLVAYRPLGVLSSREDVELYARLAFPDAPADSRFGNRAKLVIGWRESWPESGAVTVTRGDSLLGLVERAGAVGEELRLFDASTLARCPTPDAAMQTARAAYQRRHMQLLPVDRAVGTWAIVAGEDLLAIVVRVRTTRDVCTRVPLALRSAKAALAKGPAAEDGGGAAAVPAAATTGAAATKARRRPVIVYKSTTDDLATLIDEMRAAGEIPEALDVVTPSVAPWSPEGEAPGGGAEEEPPKSGVQLALPFAVADVETAPLRRRGARSRSHRPVVRVLGDDVRALLSGARETLRVPAEALPDATVGLRFVLAGEGRGSAGKRRATVEIVSARDERLHDVDELAAVAEGVAAVGAGFSAAGESSLYVYADAVDAFRARWDMAHGRDARWADNPEVHVLTVRVVPATSREAVGRGSSTRAA